MPDTPPNPRPPAANFAARALRTASPLSLLFSPVFEKDLRVLGRRKATYWIRAAAVLLLVAIVSIVYIGMVNERPYEIGARQLQRFQSIAPAIGIAVAWFLLIALPLIAPLLTAPAICEEKTKRTLAALATTPLTSAQIVFGTLASRLVQITIIALAVTPLLLALRLFGGLDTELVVGSTCIALTSACFTASMALLASVRVRRPATAVSFAIAMMLFLCAFPMIIGMIEYWLSGFRGGPPRSFFYTWSVSPACSLMSLMFPTTGGPPLPMGSDVWIWNAVLNLAWSLLACLAATASLRSAIRKDAVSESTTAPRKPRRRATPSPAPSGGGAGVLDGSGGSPVAVTAPTSLHDSREVSDHPVLWRELRQNAFRSRLYLILSCLALGGLAFILYVNNDRGPADETVSMALGIITTLAFVLSATSTTAGSITSEVEARTWPVLLTTPISPAHILYAKALGGLRRLWFLPAALTAHLILAVLTGGMHPLIIPLALLIMLAAAMPLCAIGVLFSLAAKRSSAASSRNLLLALALWMGLPMLLGLSQAFLFSRDLVDALGRPIFAINPLAMVGAAIDGCAIPAHVHRELRFELPPSGRGLTAVEFTLIILVVTAISAALSVAILALARNRFAKLATRRI